MEILQKMKKIWIIIWGILLIGYGFYFVGCGFLTTSDVLFQNYAFNSEAYELTFNNIMISSSLWFVRWYTSSQKNNQLFLKFYKCFGGINSSFGAKDSFSLTLDPQIEEVYFWDEEKAYLVLKKNEENRERTRG